MRVAISLTKARNKREGITRYAIEVCNFLARKNDIKLSGETVIGFGDSSNIIASGLKDSIKYIDLNILKTHIPKRYLMKMYDSALEVPLSTDFVFRNQKDVKIYFYNFIPKVKENCKRIVVIHDLTPVHEAKSEKERIKWLKAYQYSSDKADLIFVDSEFTKEDLLNYVNVSEEKIKVNYCGVDLDHFKIYPSEIDKDNIKRKYGLPDKYLLFVGQPRKNKNLYGLIDGFSKTPHEIRKQYKLVITTSNTEIHQYICDKVLEDCIVELGGVDELDLATVYQNASGLALVSFSEGFGLPLLEAMSVGTPTLASNVSCLPEIVGDASLLCDPYNVDDISKKITTLLTDAAIRSTLIERGTKRVEKYRWSNTGEMFYQEILKL